MTVAADMPGYLDELDRDAEAAREGLTEIESRIPPHDLPAEAAVLASLVHDPERLSAVSFLRAEHCYSEAHRQVLVALRAVETRGDAIDPVSLLSELRATGRLAQVGGSAYLTELLNAAPVVGPLAHLLTHARRVVDCWRARQMILLGQRVAAQGYAGALVDDLAGSARAELDALRAESPSRSPLAARLVPVDTAWLDQPPPAREYLARDARTGRGALVAHGVALLVAAGGAGKSYATISLALAVATGTPWVGCMTIERQGRTLLVSLEDPADEVRRRMYHVARAARIESLPPDAIDVLDLHELHAPLLDADGHPTEHAAALVDLVRERGPYALVVVDPLARLAGAAIDADNGAAGALVSVLEQIASAAGGLVIGVHHTSLAARRNGTLDATAIRGATALGDSARLVMLLTVQDVEHGDADVDARLGEIVTLRLVKRNHVAPWEPIELRRGEHGELLPLDAPDREMVSQARASADPTAARVQAANARDATEDAAVLRAVADRPGISTRDLEHAVRAAVGCGASRAHVAITRVARQLVIREGARRARLHYPPATVLDAPTESR